MHYVKFKREKCSVCNLCRGVKNLTWDHVPPKGGIELTSVEMETILAVMTGNRENAKPRESQNGVKYRTICKECNEYLGHNFDLALNEFAHSVAMYLKTSIQLPKIVHHKTKPKRLIKAVLGHLVAAKANVEDTRFDRLAREYVLDPSAELPDDINIFYWVYPYTGSITIRDFAMFVPRGIFAKPAMFQTMKYFPIAYLICSEGSYAGLNSLSMYRDCGLDDEVEIPIALDRVEYAHWPEAPEGTTNVFAGGQSAMDAIVAQPRFSGKL
ncbi:MAG: hypothetical protein AMJ75_01820 [Phycisphaerae bacterium SM1_79]|nr:MAG: hypothetical protein AMJ75_01820 [Phycisphaerae bacterium SM1_79]